MSQLSDAIRIVQASNRAGELCHCCRRRIPLARKEMLNQHKIEMLKRAANYVEKQFMIGKEDPNDFMVRDFTEPEDFKRFNFFSHLRLHGLIFRIKDNQGNVMRGRWGITRNGWALLRGDIRLPDFVLVKDNRIVERSEKMIGFKDIWRGESEMQTSFEYFDDAGNPVGVRPAPHPPKDNQLNLF